MSDINGPWNWLRGKLSVEDFQRLSAQVADDVIRNRREAVAREAARCVAELYNRVGKILVAMDEGKLSLAKHFLVQSLAGFPVSSDWLANHDAEVLRPWREALEDIVETGCGLIHEDSCCLTESGVIGDIETLLSQTQAASEKRPCDGKCAFGKEYVGEHRLDCPTRKP